MGNGSLESVILEGMSRTASFPESTSQTRGEELANSLTPGFGLALSIAALVLMVVTAAIHGTALNGSRKGTPSRNSREPSSL